MDNLDEVYNELIMEHSMNSYNKKSLDKCDFCELGHNPNCGDEIKLQVKLNGDIIEDMAFLGHGCAISQSSTSIMIDTLKGKTIKEAKEILKAQGASYKNLTFDSNSTVGNYAGKGNIMAFPTTVLVDKDGNIVGEPFMGGIDDQSNYDQLMKQIQSVLDQK